MNAPATGLAPPPTRAPMLRFALRDLRGGLNGLRIVCDDYIRTRGVRLAVVSVLFLTALTFWLMGSMTIITFQPGHTISQTLLGLLGR